MAEARAHSIFHTLDRDGESLLPVARTNDLIQSKNQAARLLWEKLQMAYLIERKAQTMYFTASSVNDNGKKRRIFIESRPEFAIVKLQGLQQPLPISWELVYKTALRHHEENLLLEAKADKRSKPRKKKPAD